MAQLVEIAISPVITTGLTEQTLPGGAATFTMTLSLPFPPAPVQVRVKVVEEVKAAVFSEPAVFFVPLQPPEAVQEVALVLLHDKLEEPL